MGLFMDANGLPLAFRMFEGNRNEQVTMRPLEETILSQFGMARVIVCTDAGLDSNENRVFNDVYGRNFIVTQSLKRLNQKKRDEVMKRTGWLLLGESQPVSNPKTKAIEYYNLDNIDEDDPEECGKTYFKAQWYPAENGRPEQQIIVTYSLKYKKYQEEIREAQIQRALKKLSNPSTISRKRDTDPARFIETISSTVEGEVAEEKLYYLNENVIRDEVMYDGYYALCTNLDDDVADIVRVAEGRWEIEACFRTMKTDLEARPCYLSRQERIEAHFLTCFIALLFQRILHKKVCQYFRFKQPSPMDVISTLRHMNFLIQPGEGYIPTYTRTNITDALHQLFGFRTDCEFVPNKLMKEIQKMTKK